MTGETPPERKVGAKTAEDLLLKYNLPPGSDEEAIQRVLARLGDLPVSAEKGTAPRGSQKSPKSKAGSKPVFRPAGGTPKTTVAWSASANKKPGTLDALREYDEDEENPNMTAEERARKMVAAAVEEKLRAGESANKVGLTPKERLGPMGVLKEEVTNANARARRLETALQRRDQEVEELKARVNQLARERSALATLKTRQLANSAEVTETAAAVAKRLTDSPDPNERPMTPKNSAGQPLSLKTRWHALEMKARRGDKCLLLLLRSYKHMETECADYRRMMETARQGEEFATNELRATKDALEDVSKNYAAAENLLNEAQEREDKLGEKLKNEREQRKQLAAELMTLRAKKEQNDEEFKRFKDRKNELLERTVKRDHQIDKINKKLSETTAERDAERKERRKLEEEILRVEQRMSTLRRRNKSLEVGNQRSRDEEVEELRASVSRLSMECQIKEEECQMLAGMVSKGGARSVMKSGGSVSRGGVASVARASAPARGSPLGLGPGAGLAPRSRARTSAPEALKNGDALYEEFASTLR